MAASYPTAVKAFATRNTGDTIQAAHVNDLQDEVTAIENALLNGLAHDFTIGGVLSVTAFGGHTITAGGTGENSLTIRNSTVGTGNYAALRMGNDAGAARAALYMLSSTYTAAGAHASDGVTLDNTGAGGISIHASHASGAIRLYTAASVATTITSGRELQHNAALALQGINTPAQIVANTNDYAPAAFATGFFFRISSDAARDITGLAGGAQGRLVALSNQGAFTITLKHNSGSSSAGNRLLLPGAADFLLTTMKTCLAYYDSTATAWCVIG